MTTLPIGFQVSSPEKSDLEKAAAMLESLFLYELLKRMEETVAHTNLFGENSQEQKTYRQMYFQNLADVLAQSGSLGIKQMIIKAFEDNA